jgi:hypothetical protein
VWWYRSRLEHVLYFTFVLLSILTSILKARSVVVKLNGIVCLSYIFQKWMLWKKMTSIPLATYFDRITKLNPTPEYFTYIGRIQGHIVWSKSPPSVHCVRMTYQRYFHSSTSVAKSIMSSFHRKTIYPFAFFPIFKNPYLIAITSFRKCLPFYVQWYLSYCQGFREDSQP